MALLWLEMVLKASTTGGFWPQLAYIMPFSIAGGLAANLVCSLVPIRWLNKAVKSLLMAAAGVVFCAQYLTYRKFELFFDPATMSAAAASSKRELIEQAWHLLATSDGIVHIVLFLLPVATYLYFFRGENVADRRGGPARARGVTLGLVVLAQVVAVVLVRTVGSVWDAYTNQCAFQVAVSNFGLVTGLRMELQGRTSGGDLRLSETAVLSPVSTGRPPAALDIDFSELATTTDGTWADLDRYVASLTPSEQNDMTGRFEGYNLIFVTAESLSDEAIRQDTTPTLWRMAHKGMRFDDYYQFETAGTIGGECANLLGLLASEGEGSLRLTVNHNNHLTIGNMLGKAGYEGWALSNNTYTYYDRDQTHNNLGYSNGFIGYGNGAQEWVSSQWPPSDLELVQGSFDDLYGTANHEPFDVYYVTASGQGGYTPGQNDMSLKHWKQVQDLSYSESVKGYLACSMELDAAMEWLLNALEDDGMADHTVIVIAPSHYPSDLDDNGQLGSLPHTSELYGYDVRTSFQRDHNRLIIWSTALEDVEPIVVDSPTSSIDILPTLLNLFGCEWDSRLLPGRDVFSNKPALACNLDRDWKTDLGTYYANSQEFVPNEGVDVPEGYVDAVSADVDSRIGYCRGVLTTDYYRHVFGDLPVTPRAGIT